MKESVRTIKTIELDSDDIEDLILKHIVPSANFTNRSIVFEASEDDVRGCIITAEHRGDVKCSALCRSYRNTG